MRNAYVVVKDMIDLIPENEEEKFQILKHNLSKNILDSWVHAAPEKQYSQWPWSTAEYYLNLTAITESEFDNKNWLRKFHAIYIDPNYKLDLSHYKMFIQTDENTEKTTQL